jgi:hypothetical protein
MNLNQANTYSMILNALSPISHGDTLTGVNNTSNTRLFMRSLQYVNGLPIRTPSLSENSLRTVAIRKPLSTHLLQSCDIADGHLPKSVVNLLFSGGNLMGGAKAPNDEFTLSKSVFTAFPLLELVSGAVDNFVLPQGSLRLVIWPIAREYQDYLKYVTSEAIVAEAGKISIFDLVGEETRTRGTGDESEGNQMLYTYETLAAGARFFVRFTLSPYATELCRSALGFALQQWDGFFGGQGRQGRGLMGIETSNLPDGKLYHDYILANRTKLAGWLKDGTLGAGKVLCK